LAGYDVFETQKLAISNSDADRRRDYFALRIPPGSERPTTPFEVAVQKLVGGGRLDTQAVKTMIKRPHPWRRDTLIDDWVVRRLQRKGASGFAERLWVDGRRFGSMRAAATQLAGRLARGISGGP
jgi:hypothetical protein